MTRKDITARAIFVVRYPSDTKMGSERFNAYLEGAKNAVIASPVNPWTGQNSSEQSLQDDDISQNGQGWTVYQKKVRASGFRKSLSQKRGQRIYNFGLSVRGGCKPVDTRKNQFSENNGVNQEMDPNWPSLDKRHQRERQENAVNTSQKNRHEVANRNKPSANKY